MTAIALETLWGPMDGGGGPTAEEFEEYVATHRHRLVGFALRLSGSREEAEDLVQSALEKTSAGRHRLRNLESLNPYVMQAIVNNHRSLWRRAWKRLEHLKAELPETVVHAGEPDVEIRDALWRLLDTLPQRQRAVLVLRFLEDLSIAETAEVLGCPAGTVKSHTFHALASLRDRVAGDPALVGRQTA